jgi:hypothetical protein
MAEAERDKRGPHQKESTAVFGHASAICLRRNKLEICAEKAIARWTARRKSLIAVTFGITRSLVANARLFRVKLNKRPIGQEQTPTQLRAG